jgi:hypothetical protein
MQAQPQIGQEASAFIEEIVRELLVGDYRPPQSLTFRKAKGKT